MTEQEIESLERMFPNGFVIAAVNKNCSCHIRTFNPKRFVTLLRMSEAIIDVGLDQQKTENNDER